MCGEGARGQAVRKEAEAEMARSQGQGEEVLLVSELISSAEDSAAPRPSHGEDTVFEASLVPQKAEKGLENHPSPINQQKLGPEQEAGFQQLSDAGC